MCHGRQAISVDLPSMNYVIRCVHLQSFSQSSFNEPSQSLGPADYLSLASTYPIIVIDRIPILKLSAKNQARRFISLIDALYEARCQIICSAETTLDALFFPDALDLDRAPAQIDVMMAESVTETQALHRPNVSSYDSPEMAEAPVAPVLMPLDSLSIFSGN